jgi:hypothetical protein
VAAKEFTGLSFFVRLTFAILLVGASYNPEGASYYHWIVQEFPDFGPEKAVVGVLLVIGWVIFLRATFRSLGRVGLILALAFFGSLVWLFTSWGWISPDSPRAVTYTSLGILSATLAIGMSWSYIRRRMSGQVDVDEVDENT